VPRLAIVLALLCCAPFAGAQEPRGLPFAPGEKFTFTVRVATMGAKGRSTMWIDGPAVVRGTEVYVLRSETTVGIGFVKGTDRTTSYLDPARMTALRFIKKERHIVSSADDSVEMRPVQRNWSNGGAETFPSPTDAPLDELSFIYFLRTLPLDDDSLHAYTRHYDEGRNPITVRRVGRDSITTKAGTFATIRVEMRVRDPRHYKGEGLIVLNLSDDSRRIPVRIQSVMPVVGTSVMTLESVTDGTQQLAVIRR
jgi:hypothetical protein